MSFGQRLAAWNRRYDDAPEDRRVMFVVWLLIGVGTINMVLTVAFGFPFALLVLLGIIVLAGIRLPYVWGRVTPSGGAIALPSVRIGGADWLIDLNRRYEAMPESRRFWVYPAVLLIGGTINMMLTISFGFPFGLLFLLTLLGLVLMRAPFLAGWLAEAAPYVPLESFTEQHAVPPGVPELVVNERVVPPLVLEAVAPLDVEAGESPTASGEADQRPVDGPAVIAKTESPEQAFRAGLPPADNAH